jgi:hypothetical protein
MLKLQLSPFGVKSPDHSEFVHLSTAAHRAVAALWWRMRLQGVVLPAEAGLILIENPNRKAN